MKTTPIFEIVAIFTFLIIVIGNIKFLHNIITAITNAIKEIINLLVKIGSVSKQVEYNYDAIVKLDRELKINGRRITSYVQELHRQSLMNTGRIRIILNSYPIGLYECNKDGECVWVNSSLCDLFGMESDEMLGHGWLTAVEESQRGLVLDNWMNAVKKDIPYSWGYNITNQKTNEQFRVKAIALTIRDEDRTPLLFCGSVERC